MQEKSHEDPSWLDSADIARTQGRCAGSHAKPTQKVDTDPTSVLIIDIGVLNGSQGRSVHRDWLAGPDDVTRPVAVEPSCGVALH